MEICKYSVLKEDIFIQDIFKQPQKWESDVPVMDDKRFNENFLLNRNVFLTWYKKVANIRKLYTNMSLCIPRNKKVAITMFALRSAAKYRTI